MTVLQGSISSIEKYTSVYDLLKENDFLPENISGDFCDYLQHCDDFESVCYFCINYKTVIIADSCNGDVLSWYASGHNLVKALEEAYKEEEA